MTTATPALATVQSLFSTFFSSITQSCPTLCDPMNRSTPGLPVHNQLPEFTQTHVHRVNDVTSCQNLFINSPRKWVSLSIAK